MNGEPSPRRRFRLPRSLRDLTGSELDEEVEFHLEARARDLESRGLSPEAARREARRRFGSVEALRREARQRERTIRLREGLADLGRDVRLAVRGLRRSPTFTAAAVVTLALGIGATTAIYSVVDPVLFDPLPYPQPERVVMVWERMPERGRSNVGFATYRDVAERSRSFEEVAAFGTLSTVLTGEGAAERLEGQRVAWRFFRTLGVTPALGRDFRPEDDLPDAEPVAIVSHALWRSRFGADADIVGRTVLLYDRPVAVVGVLPASFESLLEPGADVWTPLNYEVSQERACRSCRHLRVVARLAPGATREGADREVKALSAALFEEYPADYPDTAGQGMEVVRLQDELTRTVRPALLAVLGAVGLVLLVACANVSHLLLGRAARRRGELAIRAALGETRARVVRSLLVESVVLAACGGLLGVAVAFGGVELLVALSPPGLPRIDQVALDGGMLAAAVVLTLGVGLVFGLLPAVYATRKRVWRRITRSSGSRITQGAPRSQRAALVVGEVALTLVLLVGAGLLLQSLVRLLSQPPGFETEGVLTLQVEAWSDRYETAADVHAFYERLLEEVRAIPGVESASATSQLPLSGDFDAYGIQFRANPQDDPQQGPDGYRYAVGSGYLETLGIRLLRGRSFEAADFQVATAGAERPPVVILNERLARSALGSLDPLGQEVQVGGGDDNPWRTVVGVVADTRHVSLAEEADAVYLPAPQWRWADSPRTLVVRLRHGGAGPVALSGMADAIRERVRALDADAPVTRVATLEELMVSTTARIRFALLLFALFAAVAVVLAAVGIFGVLASVVTEREQEIGVRSALGASRGEILRMIVSQGLRLSVLGAGLGLAGALGFSRFLESLLFGVSRLDPATYAAGTLLLLAVAALACWIPARRAARLDPVMALRAE